MYLAANWPSRRILTVVPIHHIYGYLWTVLLGKNLSVDVWNVRGWSVESFAAALREGDLVVGYPGAWNRWGEIAWPAGVSGVCSGGAISDALVTALLTNGLGRWTEIYGCTELGAVGVKEGLSEHFELAPCWPERLEFSEVIETPDELEWLDGRRFLLGPRKDGLIEVSGMLVDLKKVREVLLQITGVTEVVLRKGPERIEAMIAGSVSPEEIVHFVEGRLPAWERPRKIRLVDEIPRSENGKPLFNLEASIDI